MANPTLVAQDDAWGGWTHSQILDEILRPFGLTNDSTTDRVEASADEVELARDALRLASGYFHAKWTSLWARRLYTVTWTVGDHSIALPADVLAIKRVYFGGYPLDPLSLEDRTRLANNDDSGNDWKIEGDTRPRYYYISGITDTNADQTAFAPVLRLVIEPDAADELVIEYTARSKAYLSADDADILSIAPLFQDWLAQRGVEILASRLGPARTVADSAMMERAKIEDVIQDYLEGTGEFPDRLRWDFPPVASLRRGDKER
jgi:hypothetical protein